MTIVQYVLQFYRFYFFKLYTLGARLIYQTSCFLYFQLRSKATSTLSERHLTVPICGYPGTHDQSYSSLLKSCSFLVEIMTYLLSLQNENVYKNKK